MSKKGYETGTILRRNRFGVAVWGVAAFCFAPAFSQCLEMRLSPREHTSETLAGKKVEITYGRPYRRGRKIFGHGITVRKLWRTGADEATTLSTDATLTVGTLAVPPHPNRSPTRLDELRAISSTSAFTS